MVTKRTSRTIWYKCGVCGSEYNTPEEAETCEKRGITKRGNLLVGDFVIKDEIDIYEVVDIRQGHHKHFIDTFGRNLVGGVEMRLDMGMGAKPLTPQKITYLIKKLEEARKRYSVSPDIETRLPTQRNNIQTAWGEESEAHSIEMPRESEIINEIERLGSNDGRRRTRGTRDEARERANR